MHISAMENCEMMSVEDQSMPTISFPIIYIEIFLLKGIQL